MATESRANQAQAQNNTSNQSATKPATPELISLSNPTLDPDIMIDLIFEDIGGQELINMSRNDIISGQDLIYSPIKNMQDIYIQYNANNILGLEGSADTYFKNLTIKLEERLPFSGTGPNGEIVYIDPTSGNLIINVSSIEKDEQVEIQIINGGSIIDDTIYETG